MTSAAVNTTVGSLIAFALVAWSLHPGARMSATPKAEHDPPAHGERRPGGVKMALLLDGNGGARELGVDELTSWNPTRGSLWLHLDAGDAQAMGWLATQMGLSFRDREELLQPPRLPGLSMKGDREFVASLRGLSPEIGESQFERAWVRVWMEPARAVSLSEMALPALDAARNMYRQGRGPKDIPDLLAWITARVEGLLHSSALELEVPMAEIEYAVQVSPSSAASRLHAIEIEITRVRRHAAPFRVLLESILSWSDSWLVQGHVERWRRLQHQAQDTDTLLQALRDRARAIHAFLEDRRAERMNYTLYVLTLLSSAMLPSTFLTGFFGMNVGIKGASFRWMENPVTPLVLFVLFTAFAGTAVWMIKRRGLVWKSPNPHAKGRPSAHAGPQSQSGFR